MTAREPFLGWDGLATLLLACGVAVASLGASLLVALAVVVRAARAAPVAASGGRIVVLGQRSPGGLPGAGFRARLDRALALAAADPARGVVVLGGATVPGAPSEAALGRAYLLAAGLAPGRVAVEDRSRHTLENLREYRRAFPAAAAPDLLVTSRFHVARAGLMAARLGLAHRVVAAEARFALTPGLLSEAFLVHWYWVGWGFARIVRSRRMLGRIT